MNRTTLSLSIVLLASAATSHVARADDPAPGKPRVWAVVVGIDRYEDRLIPSCATATRDARTVADWVARTAGWGRDHVLTLDDRGVRDHGEPADPAPTSLRPTRANLDWAVTGWLAHRVRPGDVAVVYFAGQATVRPPMSGSLAGRGYLLPIDAAAAGVDASGWAIEDALDRSGIAAKARVALWLDTSPLGRGGAGLEVLPKAPSGVAWLNALTRWPGVSAWMAADLVRVAEAGVPGPFAAAIVRGLGERDQAHNLLGCLASIRVDPTLAGQGFLAVGGIDPTLTLWPDAIRPVELAVPELIVQNGHADRVTSVAITNDGGHLISAGQDSTVRLWNLADRSLVRILSDPMNGVTAMAMNRDGTALIAGDGMGRVLGWDMALDRPRSNFGPPEHNQAITAIAFLPYGRRFVALDRGGRAILWEVDGGLLRKLREFDDAAIVRLASAARPVAEGAAIVAATEDGALLAFDSEGVLSRRLDGPGSDVTALGVSADGRKLVAGDDRGRLLLLDVASREVELERRFRGTIRLASISPGGRVLVADDETLHLADPRPDGFIVPLRDIQGNPAPAEIGRAVFSADGRWLAACARIGGRVMAWSLRDPARPEPVAIASGASAGITLGFAPDGLGLVVGDADGGIRSWSLDDRGERPFAIARPAISSARGKVAALQVGSDGDSILEITKDDAALVWQLKDRRGARPIPGRWVAGAFLPGALSVVLAAHPERGGDVVLFDRATSQPAPIVFAKPPAMEGGPSTISFAAVAVSRGGRWIAAASLGMQMPLACVWETKTGRLVHWTRSHDAGLAAVDFSGDEAFLLTASADGTAKLWDLADGGEEFARPAVVLRNPHADAPAITAARISPVDTHRVVLGTRGGRVLFWDWAEGQGGGRGSIVAEREVGGAVNAVAFSADGGWVVASGGRDKSIRFWQLPAEGGPRAVSFKPLPHHAEQVNALAAWSDGTRMVSGGDDSAIKIWDLAGRSLIGTLVAARRSPEVFDWIAFTPDGLFDGSRDGERLIKWRVGDRVVTLEQAQDSHYSFGLAETFAQAERPRPGLDLRETPKLKFVAPPPGRDPMDREVELTLWTGDRDLADLRLYQNGVPIRALDDFRVEPARPHFASIRVQLRPGENRFHALASKPGATDGRSDDLLLGFAGSEPPGQLHTLAIGVSAYKHRPLKYAHLDAERIASFLHERGIPGGDGPGERIVLTDDQVTEAGVRAAFVRLDAAVRGRPEDTVVLFLAGHTDTDLASDQFCLLLPDFPFEGTTTTEGRVDLAIRGRSPSGAGTTRVGDPEVLPFLTLYRRLARLEALQRLVIVDACQAGSILDDPSVRRIQRLVESGARKTKNSYLLAARRGEPAAEAEALRHGLLTYVLLRGMGAPGLLPIPDALGGYPGPPSADRDGDHVVSTAELVAYTDDALPKLARIFPQMVLRAGGQAPQSGEFTPPPSDEAALRLQSAEATFPLVTIPSGSPRPLSQTPPEQGTSR